MCSTLTSAGQAGARFTYPGGIKGCVDLGVGCIPKWFTCPQTVTQPGRPTNQARREGEVRGVSYHGLRNIRGPAVARKY